MISKEHKKHADIERPSYGNFGRNEWAIVGTQCSVIKALADVVITALSPSYKCAYADAQHGDTDNEAMPGRLAAGAIIDYTDKINHHQFNYYRSFNQFQFRQMFADADIILLNGNHNQAKAQVVVIDENKKSSLQKRLSQLTNVQLILLTDNSNEIFDFVQRAIPACQQLPLYRLNETDKIISFFEKQMKLAKPLLNGLVLAGGKSIRMGSDKGLMEWHGKEQRYYMADILKNLCNDVFISCRAEQEHEIDSNYKTLADAFTKLGPYGAILSAFREQPDYAWLVAACDLPLLDIDTLQYLIQHRNSSSIATTFESPDDGLPEPVITIWEPKSYPVYLSFLSLGDTCPRKVLRNNDVNVIKVLNAEALINVNTSADADKVKEILEKKIVLHNAT
jgi:molybdopterin-guanine dinucleotide biosynthesis protein A